MIAVILVLLILLALGGGIWVNNLIWILAIALIVFLILGYAGGPPAGGGPRRFYGRW